jgi:hypothetical protein
MICDFCGHEVMVPESRELLIRAWCPNCGAFSDGKMKMKLPGNGGIYRDTCKAAQENGTNLWNKVVRVKNLLRVAQPYLEEDNARSPDELELAALCNEIAKEIGSLEENIAKEEQEGRMIAERLGIDLEKWAAELRAKVDAADKKEGETDGIEK